MRMAMIAFMIGAIGSWWLTAEYKDNKWEAAIAKASLEAAAQLQAATEMVLKIERENMVIANKLEVEHVENEYLLDQVLADNRKLARELDGLHDPGHDYGRNPMPTETGSPGQPDDQTASRRLSNEASAFLLEFSRDADRVASYAHTCREWIITNNH